MENPLVSFVIFSFNQEDYIREALLGAFSQDYPRLEILISDDCSSDNTFEIVKEMVAHYSGPHQVTCSRNPVNLGIAGHINKVNYAVNGELIVVAAADDISLPGRTQSIVDAYKTAERKIHYFYSSATKMDIHGANFEVVTSPGAVNADSLVRAGLSGYPVAIGATQAWSKELVDAFGPLGSKVWAEDQILGFRGMLLGEIGYIDAPLVRYRVGSGVSTRHIQFSIKKFFRNKMKDIWILAQRSADALHVRRIGLSGIIAGKAVMLFVTIPISPFLSVMRKAASR